MFKKSVDCYHFDNNECVNPNGNYLFKKLNDKICNDCDEFITKEDFEELIESYKCKNCKKFFNKHNDELSLKIGLSKIYFYSEDEIDEIDTFKEFCSDCFKSMTITKEDIDKLKLILKSEPKLLEKIEKIKNCLF